MYWFIIFLSLLNVSSGYVLNTKYNHNYFKSKMSIWDNIDKNFKDIARNWFIYRAEKAGIDWHHLVAQNELKMNFLKYIYENIENKDIQYPEYYLKPFHGYEKGNLNWNAALEGDAATLSIAVNYWKNNDPFLSEKWLRYNITKNINDYHKKHKIDTFKDVLDVGCSIGVSTEYLHKSYLNLSSLTGIDLSPYYLSIATYNAVDKNIPIKYIHRLAEKTQFKDATFDFIICNFLLHEVPNESSKLIIKELHRILKPDGVLAIVDLDPTNVKNKLIVSAFRKWAFETTEPHINEYYNIDMGILLEENNFINIEKKTNDPVNSIWFGQKKNIDVENYEKKKQMMKEKRNNKNDELNKLNLRSIPSFTLESKKRQLVDFY